MPVSCFSLARLTILLLGFCSFSAAATADHPLVSAFEGAKLEKSAYTHYSAHRLVVALKSEMAPSEIKDVIGKLTAHAYLHTGNRSPEEALENYLQAVKKLKGKVILQCDQKSCGGMVRYALENTWQHKSRGWSVDIYNLDNKDDYRFLIAQVGSNEQPTYLQWLIERDYRNYLKIDQLIIEPEELQLDRVTVDPSAIQMQPIAASASKLKGQDIQGGKDHPLLSRYQGAVIKNYKQQEYAEVMLPIGSATREKRAPSLKVQGKVTTIIYRVPSDQSTLMIFHNYKNALQKAGFEFLFDCEHKVCGGYQMLSIWQDHPEKFRYSSFDIHNIPADTDYRTMTTKLTSEQKTVYASVYIRVRGQETLVAVDIVEAGAMAIDRVNIDQNYLTHELERQGRVILHGLNFALNQAELLPSSEPALVEIVTYMKANPLQRFYVVGHTDNTGEHSLNMRLAEQRAQTIRETLIKRGTTAERLIAAGVGPMAPLNSNNSEQGQADNRRVELVLR